MKKVKNLTGIYVIVKEEAGYYDSNGCYYNHLTKSQKRYLNKAYYFKLDEMKHLSVLELTVRKTAYEIVIDYKVISDYEYDGKMLISLKEEVPIEKIFRCSYNPETLVSYVSFILTTKSYYSDIQNWLDSMAVDDKNGFDEELYIMIFYLFKEGKDGVISELLSKGMDSTLYDFLYFHENHKNLEVHYLSGIFQLANPLEKLLSIHIKECRSLGQYQKGEMTKILSDLLACYGKENTSLIVKFICAMKKIDELSKSSSKPNLKSFSRILNILTNLQLAKEYIPSSNFNQNTNYILACICKNYESGLDLGGFVKVSSLWIDYLRMKEETDELYPKLLSVKHDEALEKYKVNNHGLSIETARRFYDEIEGYRWLEYKDDKYLVRVPKSPEEMQYIGNKLNICVGSYIRAVADGRTCVLWLCNIYDNNPCMAFEVKSQNLVQAKKRNNQYPDEEKSFINEWCNAKKLNIVSY